MQEKQKLMAMMISDEYQNDIHIKKGSPLVMMKSIR